MVVEAVHILDKLAQLRKVPAEGRPELSELTTLQKRARAKYLTQPLAMQLSKLESPLQPAYLRTLTCCHYLIRSGAEIKTKYCKARWCLTCNRIRTGKLMNAYADPLMALPDIHFVTLTAPNIGATDLSDEIGRLTKVSRRIQDVMRKRGKQLTGVRKLETTYNKQADTFHPHFHYIVSGRDQAETLKAEWLKRNSSANDAAQDIRPADRSSIKELFKYFTKLNATTTPPEALDTIFRAMEGRRVFQSLGELRAVQVSEEIEEIQAHTYQELEDEHTVADYEWEESAADWVNTSTGECLTKYQPTDKAKAYVSAVTTNFDKHHHHHHHHHRW